MKRLLLFIWLFAVSLPSFGANPSYDAFIGTNGIIVTSNPPQGRVIIDGRLLTNSLGGIQVWTNDSTAVRIANSTLAGHVWIRNSDGSLFVSTNGAMASDLDFGDPTIDTAHIYPLVALFPTNTAPGPTIWRSAIGTVVNGANQEYSRIFIEGDYDPAATEYAVELSVQSFGPFNGSEVSLVTHNEPGNDFSQVRLTSPAGNPIDMGSSVTASYIRLGVSLFEVNDMGNISWINGVDYEWPNAHGAAGSVLTNDGAGVLGWGTLVAGAGGDQVWTNDNGLIKPIAFPTNILLRVSAAQDGVQTNFYFDSRIYRTNAAAKLFAIYNGGSNAVTVGPYGGLFMGRANQTPYPGVTISGIYDTAKGETNQQEIFIMSQNSAVGYLGAADILVDTNYGAIILTSQNPGGTRFSRWAIQAGAGIDPEKFNTFSMQALVDNATYFQVDPNFTLLTPTNYLFSSSVRITNTHTLLSLQNSNFPVLEVDGVGDLRLIKKVPYVWPSANASGSLVNDGSGNLSWTAAGGGTVVFSDLVWTNTGTMIVPFSAAPRALRQGVTNGVQWASTNLGILSVAFGSNNTAGGLLSSVLGGGRNTIATNNSFSVIAGGDQNSMGDAVAGGRNFIGSGQLNIIGGGASNGVISGGKGNTIDASVTDGTIVGGNGNRIRSQSGFVGGGSGNDVRAQSGTISGGINNVGGDDVGLSDVGSTIGGGEGNVASAAYMTIGGGRLNGTGSGDDATNGVIGGGLGNFIASIHSTISGGALNTIGNLGAAGVIGGGFTNIIDTVANSDFSVISGGASNRILSAHMAWILGSFGSNTTPKSLLLSPAGTHGSNRMHITATATTNIGPLKVQMGSATTAWAGVGGVLWSTNFPIFNAGVAETNLVSLTIPAHTLSNLNSSLIIEASGAMAGATAGTNQIRLLYGNNVLMDTGLQTASNGWYRIRATISSSSLTAGFTNQFTTADHFWWGTGVTGMPFRDTNFNTWTTQTNGINTTLSLATTSRINGGITNESFRVRWVPNSP